MNLRRNIEFPSLRDLLDFEKKVLNRMRIIDEISRCSNLTNSIQQSLGTFEKKKRYSFHCILAISDDKNLKKREAAVAIGVETKTNGGNNIKSVSYCISLILKDKGLKDNYCQRHCFKLNNGAVKPRIIRRFHFDYDINELEDHPMFHLQYGGNPEGSLVNNFYCLEGWLETPRIFFTPMNLPLVFDLVLREFNTELGKKLLKKSEWIKIVRESEDKILEPYFIVCREYFKNSRIRGNSLSFIHWNCGRK